MAQVKFLKPFEVTCAPQFFFIVTEGGGFRLPKWGAPGNPFFFLLQYSLPPPKAAVSKMDAGGTPTGAPKAPIGDAKGATPPEGEVEGYIVEVNISFQCRKPK